MNSMHSSPPVNILTALMTHRSCANVLWQSSLPSLIFLSNQMSRTFWTIGMLPRGRAVAPLEVVDACPLLELSDAVDFFLSILCQLEIAEKAMQVKSEKDVSFYSTTTSFLSLVIFSCWLSVKSNAFFFSVEYAVTKKNSKVFFFFYKEILEEILFRSTSSDVNMYVRNEQCMFLLPVNHYMCDC
jgi:hypothetical protein